MENKVSLKAADNIRILSAAMVEEAKSGHPGGAMGGADFIHILYSEYLKFNPAQPSWFFRDRFFLDPGHMSPMLYSQLALIGHFSMDELKNFRQWDSPTAGHPEYDIARGIENTSGPLGQGHAMGLGAAIAERFLVARFGEWMAHKTYAYISDGGIQEEISQGVGRIAGYLGLGNYIMFYDSNDVQLSTMTDAVSNEDTAAKYEAWGWHVVTIDAHDHNQIRKALDESIKETQKPSLIIGKAIMGKGAVDEKGNSYEGKTSTHGQPLSAAGASFPKTVSNLGGNAAKPFTVFPDVKEAYEAVLEEKAVYCDKFSSVYGEWKKDNPENARKLESFIKGETPNLDFSKIEQKENIATRAASATILGHFAENVENMIVASADLANSDKTDGFLKKTKPFTKGDFSGAFFHAGVAELTMAAIANGMAIHGGVIPVCGTFMVFSDYMKPAVRLAALMKLPVKYIWTHDAFRVGEDGPTHQPIEQEAQLRLMEKLRNHAGDPSMVVLRPADAVETTVAWEMALENTTTPTALLLSRQNITDIPAKSGNRYKEALAAKKGAYTVLETSDDIDVVLVANGSEVSLLVETAQFLKEKGVGSKVVSIISEGIFRELPKKEQQTIIPANKPIFGLTAGLSVNLEGIVGDKGQVHGLNHFGYSAPAKVLDEKFGFTLDHVSKKVMEYLKVTETIDA